LRSPSSVLTNCLFRSVSQPGTSSNIFFAFDLKSAGQCRSHGSGNSSPKSIARHAAKGLRAHQRWSVDGCPCRMDFSRAECLETTAIGKSTSAKRLHSLGIIYSFTFLFVPF